MITTEKFYKTISNFPENNGGFYDRAVKLHNNNFEIEAYLLILATWNSWCFRFGVDINSFEAKIQAVSSHFKKLEQEEFRTINLDNYKQDIKKIYETLSSIKGIGYTGASKIMHLRNRNLFIMWDGYIKGNKPRRYYDDLEIVTEDNLQIKKYGNGGDDYFLFLKDMQSLFKNISFKDKNRSFAKAVDEFNYVSITLPIQEIEKIEKKKKKEKK